MMITHKTECYPTIEQVKQIEINFGLRRFFFNKSIMILKQTYGDLKEKKKLIKKKELMDYRKSIFRAKYKDLLSYTSSHVLDTTLEDVMFALDSLWRKGKDIKLRKKKDSNTFRICRSGTKSDGSSASFTLNPDDTSLLRLPKIGFLKMAERLRWENKPGTIRTVTIKKEANRYFICITCEIESPAKLPPTNKTLGIDWGIKTYITAYDGNNAFEADFDNHKLKKLDKRISLLQKALNRAERFSKNWLKVKTKLQQAYLNFNNYRLNIIQEIAYEIVNKYDIVTLEDLGMNFVTRNKRLAHKVKQKPYYLLKNTLINKFNQYNKPVYLVASNYPSTQTCYSCNNVKKGDDKMKLGQSVYTCNCCGYTEDRDINAAMNLWKCKDVTLGTIEV